MVFKGSLLYRAAGDSLPPSPGPVRLCNNSTDIMTFMDQAFKGRNSKVGRSHIYNPGSGRKPVIETLVHNVLLFTFFENFLQTFFIQGSFYSADMINKKDTIQVINLMLQADRMQSFRLYLNGIALTVQSLYTNSFTPGYIR